MSVESDMVPGDVFRSPNGNLFLVLPNGNQAPLGSTSFSRTLLTDQIQPRPQSPAVKVVHIDPSLLWKDEELEEPELEEPELEEPELEEPELEEPEHFDRPARRRLRTRLMLRSRPNGKPVCAVVTVLFGK